jgi:hypothetical protein
MASFLNGLLLQLATGDTMHDYGHANRIFASDTFRSAPKHQFLFYVRLTLNERLVQSNIYTPLKLREIGSLCKTADLPKYTLENKQLNSYNRTYTAYTKIKYEPVRLTFHDDADNNLVDFWYNYYSYYFRDSDYDAGAWKHADRHTNRPYVLWGFNPASGVDDYQHLIEYLDIFTFHNNRFTQNRLLNPRILNWNQNNHDHAQGAGIMEHQVTLSYEAVKLYKGFFTNDNFPDMILRYDLTPSSISPFGGGTRSVLGPGGAVETAGSIIRDLASGNFAGAALKIARAGQTWRGADLGAVVASEGLQVVRDIIAGKNPLSRISVPSLGSLTNSLSLGNNGGAASLLSGALGAGAAALGFGSQTGATASLVRSSPSTGIGQIGQNFLSGVQSFTQKLTSNGSAIGKPAPASVTPTSGNPFKFPGNFTI